MTISKLVFKNLVRNRNRFILTLSGITIGIAALVTFLSLGSGLQGEITRQANLLGANLLVTPKGWCAYEQIAVLTGEQLPEAIPTEDVERISKLEGVTAIPYLVERSAIMNSPVSVVGILPLEMKDFKGWAVEEGNYLSEEDVNAVVIGHGLKEQFGLAVGDQITVRGYEFTIKGILSETGGNDDIAIFAPLTITQEIYGAGENVSYIAVKVDDITRVEEYTLEIEETANVAVISDRQLLNSVLAITGTVGNTLQLVAIVAVVAACFGIANTMTMAVHERKRDIGILKAIGAKNKSIFNIFLLESIIYGIIGGLLGLAIGVVFSYFASPLITQNEFTIFLRSLPELGLSNIGLITLQALGISVGASVISGLYAARRASKLMPVEAISYE
jgi:putative ABC transport system permease protein